MANHHLLELLCGEVEQFFARSAISLPIPIVKNLLVGPTVALESQKGHLFLETRDRIVSARCSCDAPSSFSDNFTG